MDAARLLRHFEHLRETPGDHPPAFVTGFFDHVPADERLAALELLFDDHTHVVRKPARANVFEQKDRDPEHVYLVLEGALDEWRGMFRITTRQAGDLLGELPTLQRRWLEQGVTATTSLETRLLAIDVETFKAALRRHPTLALSVLSAVAEHAGDAIDDEEQYNEALGQYFPRGRGRLTPGPYQCTETTLHIFFCRDGDTTVDEVGDAMPPGVRRVRGAPDYMLGVARMGKVRHPSVDNASFGYDEVMVFVPVNVDGRVRPRFHVPFMFPDNIMAIFLGREIAGLPKLRGSTFIDDLGDDTTRLLMRRLDRTELDIRFKVVPPESFANRAPMPESPAAAWRMLKEQDALTPGGIRLAEAVVMGAVRYFQQRVPWTPLIKPRLPATAWKRVFDPGTSITHKPRGWRPEHLQVDALVETPFQVDALHGIDIIELTEPIWFHPEFPVGQSVSISDYGLRVQMDMTMMNGRTLIDYRRARKYRASNRLGWDPRG